ncbi:MAG: DNA photolyase family protein [Wenzhouxiangella sp.]|nr:DNA photolyase family protein [Wenzhouxiangella sp.]
MSALTLVWFKRDLRIDDHRALVEAARRGPVLPLYIVEPDYWQLPDSSQRQQDFVADSLIELDQQLRRLGQGLVMALGDAVEVLAGLHRRHGFDTIHCHEETGNDWTFARDRAVRAWCRDRGVAVQEYPQFGVKRGLHDRDGWSRHWEAFMAEAALDPPTRLAPVLETRLPGDPFSTSPAFDTTPCPGRQPGGIGAGQSVLESFLTGRGRSYRGGISSPLSAEVAGSRLSPYITWGALSLRRIVQRTRTARSEARATNDTRLATSLNAFDQRLHWHCHFIQKLEQQPVIEFHNVHRGFDGMREHDFDHDRFQAWATGQTGYPLVDACMRYLIHHGWPNFRMRAMLMSFAAYHLWLHWREPALHLARLFTDYEPGIHFNQCQMQSGTTGINTPRIYNPVKQAQDQDGQGRFVRRWVPELAGVPDSHIFEPWQLGLTEREQFGSTGYPEPIVDYQQAAREARARLGEYRKQPGFREQARAVHQALGSRRGSTRRKTRSTKTDPRQGRLI